MTAILFPPVAEFQRTTCLVQDKKPVLFCRTSVKLSAIAAVVTVVFTSTLSHSDEMDEAVRLAGEREEKVISLKMTPPHTEEGVYLPVNYSLGGYSFPSVGYIIYNIADFTKLDERKRALLRDVTLQMKSCFPRREATSFLDSRIYENPVRGYRMW